MSAEDKGTIGMDGTIEWREAKGELHRDDGPAAIYPTDARSGSSRASRCTKKELEWASGQRVSIQFIV